MKNFDQSLPDLLRFQFKDNKKLQDIMKLSDIMEERKSLENKLVKQRSKLDTAIADWRKMDDHLNEKEIYLERQLEESENYSKEENRVQDLIKSLRQAHERAQKFFDSYITKESTNGFNVDEEMASISKIQKVINK